MRQKGAVYGGLPYDCGYVLHAAAENAALTKSDTDILGIWQHMIANLETEDKSYKPSDFLDSASILGGVEFGEFARPFLRGGADTRWQDPPKPFPKNRHWSGAIIG